ncbi:MAG: HNH endonuclease [Candidatus Angelobacter sp.]
MLRQDEQAHFIQTSVFGKKYQFWVKGKFAPIKYSEQQFRQLLEHQQTYATCVMVMTQPHRTYWMFKGKFYWESDGLNDQQVAALLIEREVKKQRQIDRAMASVQRQSQPAAYRREQIPESVRMFVWQRDGGRCVKCGGQENLEFDHIIPVSMGGSNTARNIQLLCERCNRSKGANIV